MKVSLTETSWTALKNLVSRRVRNEDHRIRGPRPRASKSLAQAVAWVTAEWKRVERSLQVEIEEDGVVAGELAALGRAREELHRVCREMGTVEGKLRSK